jgi:hypothetical protein
MGDGRTLRGSHSILGSAGEAADCYSVGGVDTTVKRAG